MKILRVTDKLLHLTFDKAMEAEPLVTCERCGLTFRSSNSTEEAKAEFERDFPDERFDPNGVSVLCDPCYEKFLAFMKGTSLDN